MSQNQTSLVSTISKVASKVSLAGAALFLALLATLHFIKAEYDPTWHMISEYAIGQHGWVMQLAFFCIAVSCLSLVVALYSQVRTVAGRIGLGLLVLAAIGMTIAGINVTDASGTPTAEMTDHGKMHGFGFMLGVPSLTLGLTLLTVSLRRNNAWTFVQHKLAAFVAIAWLSLAGMGAVFAVILPQHDGVFEPGVIVGLPNRLFMIACSVWIIAAAWVLLKLSDKQHQKNA